MENGVFDHVSSLLDHSYMAIDDSLFHSGVSDHGRCRQIFHTDPFDLTCTEEIIRNMAHNVNSSIASSSSFTSEEMRYSISNVFREVYDDLSVNQFPSTLSSISVPTYNLVGSSEQGALSFDSELSLRLCSSHPSILKIDESYSDITLPLCCGSSGVRLDLRYKHVVQEIFAELASYTLENVEKMEDSLADAVSEARMSSSGCSIVKGFKETGSNDLPFCCVENEYEEDMNCPPWEQRNSSMKSELMNMLEMVDQRFNQFIDQIQNVVSAFHGKTKLGPNLPAQFALSTISRFYKITRNRITDQIVRIMDYSLALNNGLYSS